MRTGGSPTARSSPTRAPGFLVTKDQYGDFEMKVEFYAESDTNSGIFIRCQDPQKIDAIG